MNININNFNFNFKDDIVVKFSPWVSAELIPRSTLTYPLFCGSLSLGHTLKRKRRPALLMCLKGMPSAMTACRVYE